MLSFGLVFPSEGATLLNRYVAAQLAQWQQANPIEMAQRSVVRTWQSRKNDHVAKDQGGGTERQASDPGFVAGSFIQKMKPGSSIWMNPIPATSFPLCPFT